MGREEKSISITNDLFEWRVKTSKMKINNNFKEYKIFRTNVQNRQNNKRNIKTREFKSREYNEKKINGTLTDFDQ